MVKQISYLLLILLYISPFAFLKAQERPPIDIYLPKDYGAETQNWAIAQSKEKYIYSANNKGLLEFNGSHWKLYESPNQTIMRSVSVIDNTIYTGCNREFGYWKRNDLGLLDYTSISEQLNIKFTEDEEFWNIVGIDDFILFQSFNKIYIYNKKDKQFSVIDSENIIYKMFKVNETIYYQKFKEGLYSIEKGEGKLVSNNTILKDYKLVNIFQHKN